MCKFTKFLHPLMWMLYIHRFNAAPFPMQNKRYMFYMSDGIVLFVFVFVFVFFFFFFFFGEF